MERELSYHRPGAESSAAAAEICEGKIVHTAAFEAELARVAAAAPDACAGVFGPQSMTWRVEREAALFLGAGRALLLQLAHPSVAAAVRDHSRALADPIGRFHGTFDTVFTMVFGSRDDALAM
ncbi:MAG TPA: oxygenase MpaB family protein, partial [Stellaceae bacterium]|nr:oxygenase MpaB family protein [Stellaceae bacterium]